MTRTRRFARINRTVALGAALVLQCFCAAAHGQLTEASTPAAAAISIRISHPEKQQLIPATLFGSFLEPIGHSTYGGLWANVVENPSFEEGLWSAGNVKEMLRTRPELTRASQLGLPLPWEPLEQSQGSRYSPIRGDAANSSQSILVMSLPQQEVGILQQVYLPVMRELTYNGSLWLKHVQGADTVHLSLRRRAHPKQILAQAVVEAPDEAWTRHAFTLELKPDSVAPLEPVDLVLSVSNDARVQIDNVDLNPADAIDGMDPEVVELARQLHSPIVRFGGNFTSAYDWRDGIGEPDKRISKLNLSWGIPEYNTFGTDEFLRFCELIHAQPQIALNLGTGNPGQAAEWVNYANKHWGNRQGGSLWELGNELWGDFQVGYPSKERIAAVTLATSQAVRKVDPKSVLIATGGDEDFFHEWNAQQLSNPVGSFDYLSTHFVVGDKVQLAHPSNEFRSMAALALPWGLAEKMHAIKQQADDSGHKDVKVAFTEWLMISDTHTGPDYTNMGGALFAGGFLNMVMRNSDVVSISDMTGILEFGGIWKKRGQVYAAPAYWVLREYATAKPRSLLAVEAAFPTYSISHGVTRLPEITDVPYLDVIAAENDDRSKLFLFCVNRHLSRPTSARIDFSGLGFRAATLKVTTLAAESILDENDESEPNRVIPVSHPEAVKGAVLSHTFANASVTVIEIDK